MTTVINMTPHPINIIDADGQIVRTFPKGENVVRLAVKTVAARPIEGIPTSRTQFGEAEGLPEPRYIGVWSVCKTWESFPTKDEALDAIQNSQDFRNFDGNPADCYAVPAVYYIVSQLVKSALPNRGDLLVPAEVVRDDKGQIIGCKSLGM